MKIHLKRIFIILLAVTFVFQTAAFSASSGIRVFADTEEQITGLLETEENESSTLSEKDHPDGDVLREENGEAIEMNTPETDTEEVSAEDARTEEEAAEEVYEETSEAAEEPGIFNGEVKKAAAEQPLKAAAAGTSILAFTSDTHNKSGNVAANRLGSWLDKMQGIYGRKVDLMAFGGDMANASASQTDFWTLTQADMDQLTQRNITGVYTTGNHEYSPGNYSHNMNSTTQVYIENAEGFEGSNYRIYCLGSSAYAESSGGGSWWGGGWNEYTASQVSKLSEYLDGVDNSKVIIVITHYPLHYNPQRTITGASDVIDVLNTAAGTGKKIVYLWGHNHTDADRANGEQNYDKVFKPGDSISYSSGNSKEINFYYGAAGCMSDSEYGTGSGAVKGKGLILEINEENKLTFTYYNEGATDVTEGGSFTEKDPVPIQEATIDEATEMGPDGQFTVVQPTIEVRNTLQLHYTTVPEDATVRSITWTSDDTSIATVDSTGKVKGVNPGTTTITATISDGITRGTVSASIDVEIVPRTSSDPMYVRTDTILPDKNYIIANKDTGEAYALLNNNGTVSSVTVEIDGDTIYTDNENIVFTTEGSGTTVTAVKNNSRYISASNGSLTLATSAPASRTFAYSADNRLTCRSGNSTYYIYYSSYNNGFTASTSASGSSPRQVYLFGEIEEQVAVTGVSVTPKTATVEARRTIDLTATVSPANATNRTVTWSSSNTSVAVVDGNGRVRGVSEGEAVITASVGGFSDSCTVTVTASTSSEPTYVITVGNVALSTVPSDEQMENAGSGSQRYYYTGLAGAPFDPDEAADDTIRWILEPAEGGYYIKSLSGDYLNATYTQNSTGGYSGVLKLDSTPDVWVLDGTLDSWEVDGSLLKSSNASSNASSDKYLAYDTGTTSSPRNLFTVRSEASASETTLVEAEDPVAVTGVSVTPKTATVKARETVQLTAAVTPSDATVKTVTWTSSNTAVATVDENGKVKGVAEGEAVITASAGGFSDTCTVTVTAGDPITGYVIMIDGFALSTDRSPNQAQGGNSSYTYTGLAGVAYSAEEDPAENIRWILEETDGGYYIRSLDGRYLNGAYTSGSNSGQGNLKLDDTRDVWVLDGTLEDWMIDGSMIRSTNATASTPNRPKYLGYEEAPANLFTVRSEENADESTLVDPSVTIEERFVETDRFEDGKEYIIGVTKDSGSVYAIKNVTGTNTGNTGSITLDVTPASGSEAAYIVTDDKDVVWKYSGSSQYLIASTGSDHYLGYESSSYVPRTSSQGRTIIYSGGKLQISSGRYLTCTDGTFATTTNSGSGSDVRLFVKTIEIITHEHTYGDPVWSWSGNVTTKATRAAVSATATFTCTECGESITEEAAITTSEVSGRTLYTATVTGPDGKEYTDSKYAADDSHYTITLTADKTMASPGDEVTFTITLGPVDRFGTFQMELAVPEGLTYKENSFEIEGGREGLINTLGFDDVDWTDSVRRFIGYTVGTDYISTEDTVLATFNCTVNSGFEGSAAVGLTRLEFYSSEDWELNLTDLYEIITATINTHVHVAGEMVVEKEVQATCTTDGGYDNVVYCTICEEEMSRTHVTVPATGHDWEFVDFTWTGSDETGYTAAAANYKCKHDASHTNTVDAVLTHVTTAATCEADGSTVYTASVAAADSLDKAAHSDSKTVVIEATGHDWEFVDFTWTGNDETGYTAAVANYVCKNNADHKQSVAATVTHITTPATCEVAGQTVYTATVTAGASLDGKVQSDSKTVVIEATGHDWEFVDFTWTGSDEAGYTAAVANYKCKNDTTHKQSIEATVTSVINPATCEEAGSTVYTATVAAAASLDGKAQSDTKTVVIPATDHKWEFVNFTWTGSDEEGYTAAVANYKCKTDASHTQTLKATLKTESVPATCEAAGKNVWTATVTAADSLDKAAHNDSKTVTVKALGHDWNEPSYVWNADHTAVVAIFTCKRNAAHMETVTADGDKITSKVTKEPTTQNAGEKTYTATITGPDGKTYKATATEELPVLENKEVIRIFGSDRYETSFKVADELKEQLGKDKFDQAILAYGQNFPDALAGSYLSCILRAPILLVDSRANRIKDAQDYIKKNVKAGGTIYILGETGVVPAAAVAGLDGYKVKRLGGATRYETNIEILKEAAKFNTETEILVCSGNNFPDSLSAGAVGKPILLVGAKLLDSHKDYLAGLKGKVTFTIIGGSGVISDAVMKELSAYGSTDRVWGQDRYLTSVAVAERYFKDPESGVVAYGQNFPDGLCGGVLAYTIGGPLVLTVDNKSTTAIKYAEDAGMLSGAVLGGPTLVGDNTVRNIFQMEKEDKIIVK